VLLVALTVTDHHPPTHPLTLSVSHCSLPVCLCCCAAALLCCCVVLECCCVVVVVVVDVVVVVAFIDVRCSMFGVRCSVFSAQFLVCSLRASDGATHGTALLSLSRCTHTHTHTHTQDVVMSTTPSRRHDRTNCYGLCRRYAGGGVETVVGFNSARRVWPCSPGPSAT